MYQNNAIFSADITECYYSREEAEDITCIDNQGLDYCPKRGSALSEAIYRNDSRCFKQLISTSHVNPYNHVNTVFYQSPLEYAVEKENLECIDLLLDNGANIDAENVGGNTALVSSAIHNQFQIAQARG